jgi:hypothetical protein
MAEHSGECKLTFGKELDYSQVWSFGMAIPHLSTINIETLEGTLRHSERIKTNFSH